MKKIIVSIWKRARSYSKWSNRICKIGLAQRYAELMKRIIMYLNYYIRLPKSNSDRLTQEAKLC